MHNRTGRLEPVIDDAHSSIMDLAHEILRDVRHVNEHLGWLRFLIETAELRHREREIIMAALDTLTASVGNLEAASAAAVAEIGTLTSGSDESALTALAGRIDAVTVNLTAAVPAPAPAT